MVQLQRTTQETSHRKTFNQAGGQAKASQMSSTTEKPKRKTTDENFDTTQRKRPKQFEPSSSIFCLLFKTANATLLSFCLRSRFIHSF
ncbi:unnamed protein product [Rotaria socialis]|uniref:Uncharacterized protein n=1 Tax=Rotaria socialis TaxID=392032 RepID=A0A821J482_9BILA|nr:unnamed protein product [Rotaria socialis]